MESKARLAGPQAVQSVAEQKNSFKKRCGLFSFVQREYLVSESECLKSLEIAIRDYRLAKKDDKALSLREDLRMI